MAHMSLENIIRLPQEKLFSTIAHMFPKKQVVVKKGKYILVKGDIPLLLVAHLDTVHHDNCTIICYSEDGNILMSPQGIGGDDRCGVYGLLEIHGRSRKKPWLLFTCDEETGGHGAKEFARDLPCQTKLRKTKLIIELDRKGKDDAVYYDCDSPELEDYISSKGFKTEWGSYSDICDVAPALEVAAVNLSSGYYNAHTQHEYINRKQLENTIKRVLSIIADIDTLPQYEWKEYIYKYSKYSKYSKWDDWDYGYDGYPYYGGYESYVMPDCISKVYTKDSTFFRLDPKKLNMQDKEFYDELLDFYSEDELAEWVAFKGINGLEELYWESFGIATGETPKPETIETIKNYVNK